MGDQWACLGGVGAMLLVAGVHARFLCQFLARDLVSEPTRELPRDSGQHDPLSEHRLSQDETAQSFGSRDHERGHWAVQRLVAVAQHQLSRLESSLFVLVVRARVSGHAHFHLPVSIVVRECAARL